MGHSFWIVMVAALTTVALRFLPFAVFRKNAPEAILYLGRVLPYAIMAMLVVYCLKDVQFFSGNHGIPEVIAVIFVVVLHKWKHNTLLSVFLGTVCYMLLIQSGLFG